MEQGLSLVMSVHVAVFFTRKFKGTSILACHCSSCGQQASLKVVTIKFIDNLNFLVVAIALGGDM